jgi:hypothetical protein
LETQDEREEGWRLGMTLREDRGRRQEDLRSSTEFDEFDEAELSGR